jgi:galactitol PTS system EIIA component
LPGKGKSIIMVWTQGSLVLAPLKADNAEQAIRLLAGILQNSGYVQDTFVDAVLEREEVYPTGLPTPEFHVAIPHTDPVHVIQPAVALGVLDKPVEFKEMGNPDSSLKINLICMLAVKQSETLVNLLGSLISCFQDADFLQVVCASKEPDQIANLFNSRIS